MDRRTQRVPRPVLPDPAGLGPDHRLSCLAREGFGEFRHVTHYAVNAILFRGMRVGDGVGALAFGALVAAIPLREADEKTLLRGEAADGFQLLCRGGALPCAVGQNQATRSEEHTSELQSLRHLV